MNWEDFFKRLVDTVDGLSAIRTTTTLEVGDIQIGAVELKDEDSDDRAEVKAGNTAAVTDIALVTTDPNVKASVDAIGALEANPSLYSSAAAETSGVPKASAGTLLGFAGVSLSASDQYIQIHDLAAVPGDGAIPIFCVKANAADNFFLDLSKWGITMSNGIVIANSSTAATLTIGPADCLFYVLYK